MDTAALLRAGALAALLLVLLPVTGHAEQGAVCDVGGGSGPVSLILVASPQQVRDFAKATRGRIVRQGPDTVVFADGRIITSNAESATGHLNALGWASRRIEVAASFRPRARRARG
ncbi:MAG: hypothetical protein QNK04_13770 [Myxococcota bacterium]|nr:hypothetical protein [Myxococcota bacterium]